MAKKVQVIIVGGGPVGVGLAIDLGQRGVSCAVIEKRPGMHNIPKGQNLSARTLEHFHAWGVVDEIRASRPTPREVESNGVIAYKNLMSEHWFATQGREIVRSFYGQTNDRMPQYLMEAVLRKRMATLPTVSARLGWTVKELSQDATGVRVTAVQDADGQTETLEADYVVGCDGGQSIVRTSLGIARGGTDFDQPMALMVFRSRQFHEGLKRFPERSTYRVMDPALNGYWQFFGRVDVGEKFFFHAPVPVGTRLDNFDFKGLLHTVAGFTFDCEFDYVGFWDLRVQVAEQYQVGRAFIAGDAAHTHPPYGGYGVNNGLEDSRNLGWKLAARLQGWGSDALLASYSEERRAIFKETADDFIAARIAHEGKFLATYDPAKDLTAFKGAWKDMEADVGNRISTYAPHYEGSPVIAGPPGGRSSAHGKHTFEAKAGQHLPPQKMSSGRSVFDEIGWDFALIALDAADATVAAFTEAAAGLKVPLKCIRDTAAGGREEYKARLILVRPDHYIVWAGNAAPADPRALLAKAVGKA